MHEVSRTCDLQWNSGLSRYLERLRDSYLRSAVALPTVIRCNRSSNNNCFKRTSWSLYESKIHLLYWSWYTSRQYNQISLFVAFLIAHSQLPAVAQPGKTERTLTSIWGHLNGQLPLIEQPWRLHWPCASEFSVATTIDTWWRDVLNSWLPQ